MKIASKSAIAATCAALVFLAGCGGDDGSPVDDDAGSRDAGGAVTMHDAGTVREDGGTARVDAAGMDAGEHADAGTTRVDAGTTTTDAGSAPVDSGATTGSDAGTTPASDAGTASSTDAGTPAATDAGTAGTADAGRIDAGVAMCGAAAVFPGYEACQRCLDGACCSDARLCANDPDCLVLVNCSSACDPSDTSCAATCEDAADHNPFRYWRHLHDCVVDSCASVCPMIAYSG